MRSLAPEPARTAIEKMRKRLKRLGKRKSWKPGTRFQRVPKSGVFLPIISSRETAASPIKKRRAELRDFLFTVVTITQNARMIGRRPAYEAFSQKIPMIRMSCE